MSKSSHENDLLNPGFFFLNVLINFIIKFVIIIKSYKKKKSYLCNRPAFSPQSDESVELFCQMLICCVFLTRQLIFQKSSPTPVPTLSTVRISNMMVGQQVTLQPRIHGSVCMLPCMNFFQVLWFPPLLHPCS